MVCISQKGNLTLLATLMLIGPLLLKIEDQRLDIASILVPIQLHGAPRNKLSCLDPHKKLSAFKTTTNCMVR